jgi:putative membrane protein
MKLIGKLLIYGLAIVLSAKIYPKVQVDGYGTAILAAILLTIASVTIKPILTLLTLPITVITLGLFLVVVNAIILLMVSALLDGFQIGGFWNAVLYSILLAIIHAILEWLFEALF